MPLTDGILARALKDRGRADLAQEAVGSEFVRRFQFGINRHKSLSEVYDIIEGHLRTLPTTDTYRKLGVNAWLDQEWSACHNDPRRKLIQRLIAKEGD